VDQPIAITGAGMMTAQGAGVEQTWRGVVAGRDALTHWMPPGVSSENHALARLKVARCPEPARPVDLPPRLWAKLSRTQQLACVAVDEALQQAALPRKLDGVRAGVFIATTIGGMDQIERFYATYREDAPAGDPDLIRRLMPFELGGLIARRHAARSDGIAPEICLTTCVGSAMAITAAADAIAQDECDVAIAGGSESLCRVVLSGFNALKVVAADGCRPFDKNRPGMTVGEGAGILILERPAHAAARGARPLAYLRGATITCDAHHLTAPDPAGIQASCAIREALERAQMSNQIEYINAHGTGTRDNDAMECVAIREVFGVEHIPPVSSTKRTTGHTFGAAAAIEAIICIRAMIDGIVPVNAGSVEPDESLILPVVRGSSLRRPVHAALSTNFAFGGNNAALVFSKTLESP